MGQVLSMHRRRRRHPRYPISQPVALVHNNATVATSMARNLSGGGLQLICDRLTSDSLHNSSDRIAAHNRPGVDVHFRLPTSEGLVKLDIACLIAYITEHDVLSFAIGLEFDDMSAGSRRHLHRFLDEAVALDA